MSGSGDAFEFLLKRWASEVIPLEQTGWEAKKIAADFGKLGLTSAFLLNGGALVALPPMMQWLNSNGRSLVAITAIWLPIGIVMAVVAAFAAYANFLLVGKVYNAAAHRRARELDSQHLGKRPQDDPEWKRHNSRYRRARRGVSVTQVVAITAVLLSFACFALSVFGFINLAHYNTL